METNHLCELHGIPSMFYEHTKGMDLSSLQFVELWRVMEAAYHCCMHWEAANFELSKHELWISKEAFKDLWHVVHDSIHPV